MERSKSLSIQSIKRYKIFTAIMLSMIMLAYIYIMGFSDNWTSRLIAVSYIVLGVFVYWPRVRDFLKKIKEVSYDKENLYVKEGEYEIQIPFYEVKDIEIMSLDGLYKFTLYHHDQFGNEVICKPSLWYPLNHKRIDAELNRIRGLVRKAHHEYHDKIGSGQALPSNLL